MPTQRLNAMTLNGKCPCYLVTPDQGGGGPAILCYMDAGGIRPAILEIAQKLANAGYVVLVPDLFYRFGPYGPLVPKEVFSGDVAAVLGPLMATTGNAKSVEDLPFFLALLEACPDVRATQIGAVGFCMGGGMAITAAASAPQRIFAVASFHGGGLATDAPDSPHLCLEEFTAELYIAAATDDAFYPPDMAVVFEQALVEAKVTYNAETFPAAHGWMIPDFPVYNKTQAEHGWTQMFEFFDRTLKQSA